MALARHFREAEGLSIAQIADRLGRSPATIKAYFYDPTGEKARAVKARCVGVCRGCGAYTQPRKGKGDAYAYCKACHPGAIERRWTRERMLAAMLEWRARYGRLPSSYDWSRTHARGRGGEALGRLAKGEWPAASVVTRLFGTWEDARAAAAQRTRAMETRESASASSLDLHTYNQLRGGTPVQSTVTAGRLDADGIPESRGPSRCTGPGFAQPSGAKIPHAIRP